MKTNCGSCENGNWNAALTFLSRSLNDAVLGFLALLSLFILIMPSVFQLGTTITAVLAIAEIGIVVMFAVEYAVAFALATNKLAFVKSPWRVVDALIVFSAVVAMLPVVPDGFRNSPALRLFRLSRFALLGSRSGFSLTTRPDVVIDLIEVLPAAPIRALLGSENRFEDIDWQDGLARIRSATPDWLLFNRIDESQLPAIADALKVPLVAVESLFRSTVPRVDRLGRFTSLFVRYPLAYEPGETLRRTPILLVGTEQNVVVLCLQPTDLEERIRASLQAMDEAMPPMSRATFALIGEVVAANARLVDGFEVSLARLESDQSQLRDEAFLARTFELRADILKVRSSLKYLKNAISDISVGRLSIAGVTRDDGARFRLAAEDAGDLFETTEDLRVSLQSLVDLRLNVSSFQMNRVMRLLALLTTLALIPATIGGLLGMNVSDAPWSVSLPQVAFGVAFGMSLSFYVFAIKCWLR